MNTIYVILVLILFIYLAIVSNTKLETFNNLIIINILITCLIVAIVKIIIYNELLTYFLISYTISYSFVGLTKCFIFKTQSFITIKQEQSNYNNRPNFSFLFLISPDYFFTLICKRKYKGKTRELIKIYNMYNFYCELLLLLLCTYSFDNICAYEFLITYIFVRFISRSLEIIVSFMQDIFSNENKSLLEINDRIRLCFISIAELILFSINMNYLIDKIEYNNICFYIKLSQYVINALSGIFNNFNDSTTTLNQMFQLLYIITLFALIGNVLSTYISRKENKNDENN